MKRKLSENGVLLGGLGVAISELDLFIKTAESIETSLSRRPNPIYLSDGVGEIFTLKFTYLLHGAFFLKKLNQLSASQELARIL
jgi:hypothetical protein